MPSYTHAMVEIKNNPTKRTRNHALNGVSVFVVRLSMTAVIAISLLNGCLQNNASEESVIASCAATDSPSVVPVNVALDCDAAAVKAINVPPLDVQNVENALAQAAEDIRLGNYAHAYLTWRELANKRDPEAEYNLGWIYHNGYGVAVDNSAAAYWWQRAAGHGKTEALFDLGNLYYHGGKGIKRSFDDAIPWFMQAAEEGHEEAKLLLTNLVSNNHRAVADQRAEVIKLLAEAAGGLPLRVKPAWANLRATPAITGRLVKAVPRGTLLTKLDQQDDWLKVKLPDLDEPVWISVDLVMPVLPPA